MSILPKSLLLAALGAILGCSGTSGGGPGDLANVTLPEPDELGEGQRLAELLGPATWLDPSDADSLSCKSPSDCNVVVTGSAIVAIDRFDETGDGQLGNYYVEDVADSPVPYSGVTIFDPSFTPPDLRLAESDVVDTGGVLSEFLGPSSGRFGDCKTLPEIGGTLAFRFEHPPLPAVDVPLEDLKSYATARPWLGMLIRVADVSVAEPTASSGRYTAPLLVGAGVPASDVPSLSNELFDLEADGPPLAQDTHFAAVTGILTYFYGFHIAPRSAADFEP